MQKNFTKIDVESIKEGTRFTAPVFFEDGKNMFLAEGKTIKPYHLSAIKRWQIPYLLTYGHVIGADADTSEPEGLEELEPLEEL